MGFFCISSVLFFCYAKRDMVTVSMSAGLMRFVGDSEQMNSYNVFINDIF